MDWVQKPIQGRLPNRNSPFAYGLIAGFLFNEQSGLKTHEFVNSGTYTLSGNTLPLWFPGGLFFDGGGASNCRINLATLLPFINVLEGTIVFRIKTGGWSANPPEVIIAFRVNAANNIELFRTNATLLCKYKAGNVTIQPTITLAANTVYTIAFTWSVSNDLVACYSDGVFRASVDTLGTWAGSLAVGDLGLSNSTNAEFEGEVHYLYMYDRALTADEIAWLYREPYIMFDQFPIWLYDIPVAISAVSFGKRHRNALWTIFKEEGCL